MLGVRRASVTDTLAALERRRLIRTARGRVVVTDGPGLERIVCECHRIINSAGERLLEGKHSPSPLEHVTTSRDGYSTVGDGTPMVESTDEP